MRSGPVLAPARPPPPSAEPMRRSLRRSAVWQPPAETLLQARPGGGRGPGAPPSEPLRGDASREGPRARVKNGAQAGPARPLAQCVGDAMLLHQRVLGCRSAAGGTKLAPTARQVFAEGPRWSSGKVCELPRRMSGPRFVYPQAPGAVGPQLRSQTKGRRIVAPHERRRDAHHGARAAPRDPRRAAALGAAAGLGGAAGGRRRGVRRRRRAPDGERRGGTALVRLATRMGGGWEKRARSPTWGGPRPPPVEGLARFGDLEERCHGRAPDSQSRLCGVSSGILAPGAQVKAALLEEVGVRYGPIHHWSKPIQLLSNLAISGRTWPKSGRTRTRFSRIRPTFLEVGRHLVDFGPIGSNIDLIKVEFGPDLIEPGLDVRSIRLV